jgi:hypothetical protein
MFTITPTDHIQDRDPIIILTIIDISTILPVRANLQLVVGRVSGGAALILDLHTRAEVPLQTGGSSFFEMMLTGSIPLAQTSGSFQRAVQGTRMTATYQNGHPHLLPVTMLLGGAEYQRVGCLGGDLAEVCAGGRRKGYL